MRTLARIAIILALLAPHAIWKANAQSALPGLVGIPRGTTGCQYLSGGETLGNGAGSLLQCNSTGQLLTSSTPLQSGSVLSATNGTYTNILQGNAVLATG